MNRPHQHHDRGSILIMVPVSLMLAVGLVLATMTLATDNLESTGRESRRLQAYYVAKAGIERQVYDMKKLTRSAVLTDPFAAIDVYHDKKTYLGCIKMAASPAPPNQEPLSVGGNKVDVRDDLRDEGIELAGNFDVSIHIEGYDKVDPSSMSNSKRFVTIRSTGWVPDRDTPGAVSHTIETTVLVELSASEVFDYAYFINNWGWFYGSNIDANGNVRSNGQFDAGNYRPEINGNPRYVGANGSDLYGYMDDNDDGVKDGTDGGIYAGWDIVGTKNVGGMAGLEVAGETVNQHDFDSNVDMPNLTDLTLYEEHGKSEGASVKIGGVEMTDAVYGDEGGETGNLVLIGTPTAPIVIDGTVVVRGDLIIKGNVTGQGVIYAGGNVYIADDITYVNGPSSKRPGGTSEDDVESWLQANSGADALGLFAREHIVMGDYTNSTWRSNVKSWMNNSLNQSKEDAGEDGIPNTKAGLDGIMGTADDDVLEGDGKWTVEEYSELHAMLGLIPDGAKVGDPIPGTGEDIDGDGQNDGAFDLSELDLAANLNGSNWGGNLPGTATKYSDIATNYIANFDCALYTNHALAGLLYNSSGDIRFNGCVVSRNEAIIYNAKNLVFNHDARLTGGGDNFGFFLPRSFRKIRFVKTWDNVPNIHWDEAAAQTGHETY
ncbi:MAG: pilus assembly PilX N-terminal domain-containing protein [Planctomycetes bacterium]|nr:pilus assembly PilX N-terminal domain-containing protein [Planctomycetota bacterium]